MVPATRPLPAQHPIPVRTLVCATYFQCIDSCYGRFYVQRRSAVQATGMFNFIFMYGDYLPAPATSVQVVQPPT